MSQTDLKNLQGNPFDRFVDPLADGAQGRYYHGTSYRWAPLIEDYADGKIALHLHLWFGNNEGPTDARQPDFREQCTILQWPWRSHVLFYDLNTREDTGQVETAGLKRRAREMKCAVLIEVGEFMKFPEGVANALPCAIRLRPLNQCSCSVANSIQHQDRTSGAIIAGGAKKDGEAGLSGGGRFPGFEDHQLPNEVVKGGSEIVQDLANFDPPHGVGAFADCLKDGQIAPFMVVISSEGIRLSIPECNKLGVQRAELLICSAEL